MPLLLRRSVILAAIGLVTVGGGAFAAGPDANHGSVVQSSGAPVAQNPSPPPLKLSDAQRTKIANTVGEHATGVSLQLKTAKPAAGFAPAVGEKIPKALKAHPFPAALYPDMPALKEYKYIKFKNQVLIVNPMTKKIVDLLTLGPG